MIQFQVIIYEKKVGCSGVLSMRHQPTEGKIEIPLGDFPSKEKLVETAKNCLKSIQSDLNRTIEITQKHIDTNCEHIPYYSEGKYRFNKIQLENEETK